MYIIYFVYNDVRDLTGSDAIRPRFLPLTLTATDAECRARLVDPSCSSSCCSSCPAEMNGWWNSARCGTVWYRSEEMPPTLHGQSMHRNRLSDGDPEAHFDSSITVWSGYPRAIRKLNFLRPCRNSLRWAIRGDFVWRRTNLLQIQEFHCLYETGLQKWECITRQSCWRGHGLAAHCTHTDGVDLYWVNVITWLVRLDLLSGQNKVL